MSARRPWSVGVVDTRPPPSPRETEWLDAAPDELARWGGALDDLRIEA